MKYRKKDLFDAKQWKGENFNELREFVGKESIKHIKSDCKKLNDSLILIDSGSEIRAYIGEWIIKDVFGVFLICKDNVFKEIFEEAV